MENIKNKIMKYNYQENKYSRGAISNINHTNINNNINITNYYPSPTQNYCKKETFTFINNNSNDNTQNTMNYPLKTNAHKTKIIKETSPISKLCDKKYNQCQSPYMKKILPSSKRQKSEGGTRIIKIYKNSPSFKCIKSTKKKSTKYNIYDDNISERKNETQQYIDNNQKINKNYYLDLSSDEISNKYKSNIFNNVNYYSTKNNNNNNKDNNKYFSFKIPNNSVINNKKSIISRESNDKRDRNSLFNFFERPFQMSVKNNKDIYKIKPYDKDYLFNSNYYSVQFGKNSNYIDNKIGNKLWKYIILIQSTVRGFLLRIKLAQYLNLYERIKKAMYIIQYIILKKMRFNLYFMLKYNFDEKFKKYNNNMYSCLIPNNNISLEFKNKNMKCNKIIPNESFIIKSSKNALYQDNVKDKNRNYQYKNNEISEIQKELNKKKIDYAVAEKRIKELLIENKKVQNINNIIVRDNKQLALKLKNIESYRFNILKMQNTSFCIPNLSYINKYRIKINNILNKIIMKKELKTKLILYKYFYKFNLKTKLVKQINDIISKNDNKKLIIESNNFIINENIISNNIINENENNNEKKYRKLKLILCRKNINSYIYKNVFEKWVLRALIVKNKAFIKEKKKKKKEKFKQRKQKKLNGNNNGTNDKKNEDENENSVDSDEYEGEPKSSNK
jgi:hypothetical protein